MPHCFGTLDELLTHGFDTVIDVRSPAEFAQDHIPNAVNLPAMSNEERAQVGTIYKQESPFKARKIGAAIVSRNMAAHLEGPLANNSGEWRPLVYCWRGGQRSGSIALILDQVGWRTATLQGGYQAYRRLVCNALYKTPMPHKFILLDGFTGTAKTEVLKSLVKSGIQTLDLEGIANHRGSMLGGYNTPQPSQKMFESKIAHVLAGLDPDRPVIIEAESSKIGRLNVPPMLWEKMYSAPKIIITAPLQARISYLVSAYSDVVANHHELIARLQPLRQFRGHKIVDQWENLIKTGDLSGFAGSIITNHYDPAYSKSQIKSGLSLTVTANTLDEAGIHKLAIDIQTAIRSILSRLSDQ